MLDLLFLLLLMTWSAGVGLAILRRLAAEPEHPTDRLALAVPLGLGALALATMGLAELGWLGRPGLAVLFGLGAGLGLGERAGLRRLFRDPVSPEGQGGSIGNRWIGLA